VAGVSDQLLLGNLTPGALLGVVFLLIMFGRLVPLAMVKARMADKDEIITDLRGYITVLEHNNAQLRRGNNAAEGLLNAAEAAVSPNSREAAGADDH
jgi:hypothetical protein